MGAKSSITKMQRSAGKFCEDRLLRALTCDLYSGRRIPGMTYGTPPVYNLSSSPITSASFKVKLDPLASHTHWQNKPTETVNLVATTHLWNKILDSYLPNMPRDGKDLQSPREKVLNVTKTIKITEQLNFFLKM